MAFDVPKLLATCLLRDFVKEDAECLADIEYDPIVKKYVGLGLPETPRMDWVRSVASSPDLLCGWAIEALPERVLAGRASLKRPKDPAQFGTLELQIVIAKPFWGRKFGRQVAAALIEYAFSDQRTVAVIAEVHPENRASRRLLEAFSFVDTGMKNSEEHLKFALNRSTYNLLDTDASRRWST